MEDRYYERELAEARVVMAELLDAARAYRDQQAMPDSDNERRDAAIARAEDFLR